MAGKKAKPAFFSAEQIARMQEKKFVHALDRRAIRHTRSLGDAAGLSTIGVHLVRVKQGDRSTVFHLHHQDEEWIYILSGCGIAEIGNKKLRVGAGDFMGFVTGSEPHGMSNPHEEDLVYLVGGNRSPFDVCDYPRLNKRRYRVNGENQYVALAALSAPLRRYKK